jgi:hypothetical protein
MNNGRLWLVVKPTVGIPLFLGAVAVGSLAVHIAVLSYAGWYTDLHQRARARHVGVPRPTGNEHRERGVS